MKKLLIVSVLLVTMIAVTAALPAGISGDQAKKNVTDYLLKNSSIKYGSAVVTANDTYMKLAVSPVASNYAMNYALQLASISLATRARIPNMNTYDMVITDSNGKERASMRCTGKMLDAVKNDQNNKPTKDSMEVLRLSILTTLKIIV